MCARYLMRGRYFAQDARFGALHAWRDPGSGLARRWEPIRDAQIIDGLLDEYSQSFTYHYNFPPFSVGEVRPMRGPGPTRNRARSASRARPWRTSGPRPRSSPIRFDSISDITESNGSSSMASVCGGSLALMDAGVPINQEPWQASRRYDQRWEWTP